MGTSDGNSNSNSAVTAPTNQPSTPKQSPPTTIEQFLADDSVFTSRTGRGILRDPVALPLSGEIVSKEEADENPGFDVYANQAYADKSYVHLKSLQPHIDNHITTRMNTLFLEAPAEFPTAKCVHAMALLLNRTDLSASSSCIKQFTKMFWSRYDPALWVSDLDDQDRRTIFSVLSKDGFNAKSYLQAFDFIQSTEYKTNRGMFELFPTAEDACNALNFRELFDISPPLACRLMDAFLEVRDFNLFQVYCKSQSIKEICTSLELVQKYATYRTLDRVTEELLKSHFGSSCREAELVQQVDLLTCKVRQLEEQHAEATTECGGGNREAELVQQVESLKTQLQRLEGVHSHQSTEAISNADLVRFFVRGGNTALHFAAKVGSSDVANLINEVNVDYENYDGETPLHMAAKEGRLGAVMKLLIGGATIAKPSKSGNTPLHISAREGHVDVVTALIRSGADPNCKNAFGRTPLIEAASKDKLAVVQALIREGADPNQGPETALHYAVSVPVVEFLICNGAKVDAKNNAGETPLLRAAISQHDPDIVRRLIQGGADATCYNHYGWTPLHYAAQCGHADVAKILIDAGAKNCEARGGGETPLEIAERARARNPLTYHVISTKCPQYQ